MRRTSGASTLEISGIFFRGHSHRGNINAREGGGGLTDTAVVRV